MKRLLLPFLGLLLGHTLVHAQTIKIEYDKLSGTVKYTKCEQKKDRTLCKPIEKPKLKNGDVVEMKLTNINEFVYKAKTITRIDKDTTSRNFGTGFGSFLGSTQSLFGNLNFGAFDISQMQEAMSGLFNMGGTEALIPDEVQRELIPIQQGQRQVEEGLDRIVQSVRTVDATLERVNELRLSRDKPLQRIRQERDSLLANLTAKVPGALEDGFALRTGRDLSDHLAAANRLVNTEYDLMASLKNDLLTTLPKRKQEDLDAIARNFDVNELDAHIKEITAISRDLDRATFEYTETVTLDNDEATGLSMNVEIYDQTRLAEAPTVDGLQPGKVVRYFSDRWVTPAGTLTDTLCDGCTPLRSAEGFFHGSPYDPALGTSNSDVYGRSGAYGPWKRWDRDGKLVEEFFIDRPDLAGLVNPAANSGPSPVLEEKKVFRLPVNRGLILSTSVGVSVSSLLDPPKEYQLISDDVLGYSILLETSRSNIIPVVSSYFHFHWDSDKNVHIGGNLGLGVALSEQSALNVMGGPSVIFGRKQTLILNMGLTASQVDRKVDYLPVGEPFETSLAYNDVTTKQWGLGIFIGLSFGVGLTGQ